VTTLLLDLTTHLVPFFWVLVTILLVTVASIAAARC
jgi:hypothetical protein